MLPQSASCRLKEEAHTLADDMLMLAQVLPAFLTESKSEQWHQRESSTSKHEWTLHQTVAHLTAAAEFYRSTLYFAMHQQTPVPPSFQRRDLPIINQRDILSRQHHSSAELIATFQKALLDTVEMARQLTSEQLSWSVAVPTFNRPITLFELLEAQVMHPGMVHAAQIAYPSNTSPLWQRYEDAVLHRMLTRFFRLMALVYWPERGKSLCATFRFIVAGSSGGQWCVHVSPQQCEAWEGKIDKAQLTLWFANADTLCLLLTNHLRISRSLLRGKLFGWGNLLIATQLSSLFSPT